MEMINPIDNSEVTPNNTDSCAYGGCVSDCVCVDCGLNACGTLTMGFCVIKCFCVDLCGLQA